MDTQDDDERTDFRKLDDDERPGFRKPDDELLSFRIQGIGADQCALGF
jgi:hypothetical protein